MAYVIADPEMMTAVATDLAGMGSDLSEAHTAAAAQTVALVPAAADEVSAGVAQLFSRYAEDFHGLAGKASAFHEQFAQHLTASAGAYAGAEDAIAAFLQDLTAPAASTGLPPAVLQELPFLILLGAISSVLLPAITILGVALLPLVIAVTLPLSIGTIALIVGVPILAFLFGELGALL
jgi:hypothetical protein